VSLRDLFLPAEGRLSAEDIRLFSRLAPLLPEGWRVAHLHPARGERRALPRFEAVSSRNWDLLRRRAPLHEVLLAGRMPGLTRVGELRFQSTLHSCRLLIVLDSTRLGEDGPRLLAEIPVTAGYLRLYRGDFSDPLLRVDDYPTGVRPILNDLSPLHDVLSRIDEAALPFHLGIVPALLEDRMVPFLRGLSHLVVSMHGYAHGYAKYSKILLDAGDPFNQKGTVGGFDEFAGQDYTSILEQLREGRRILESRLGQLPLSYIPPCNAGNRNTGRALSALGFEYVLSEKPVPGCNLPEIASDFYDRSSALKADSRLDVASLHATWEADMTRAGDSHSLPTFLSALVERRTRTRERLAGVADAVTRSFASG
jgi:hypothetical protein